MWSLGALVGPPLVGEINDHIGPAGLMVSLILFTAIFIPFVGRDWWQSRGQKDH